jgi:hypothetical protein
MVGKKLNVLVQPINGRRLPATKIIVRMGGDKVAEREVGGVYNVDQALREFKRFPNKFTPMKDWDVPKLQAIAA